MPDSSTHITTGPWKVRCFIYFQGQAHLLASLSVYVHHLKHFLLMLWKQSKLRNSTFCSTTSLTGNMKVSEVINLAVPHSFCWVRMQIRDRCIDIHELYDADLTTQSDMFTLTHIMSNDREKTLPFHNLTVTLEKWYLTLTFISI